MPRIIHLIAGYRRTGKDTLHRDLISGEIVYVKSALPWCDYTWIPIWIMFALRMISLVCYVTACALMRYFGNSDRTRPKWIVFSNRTNAIRANQEYLLVTHDRQQAAFARELKRRVHAEINRGLPFGRDPLSDEWFEQNKDHRFRIGEQKTTPRELYISVGEGAKRRDPIIWVRKCFDSFARTGDFTDPRDGPEIMDITDWRFPNEQIYAMLHSSVYRIFTTRIYRTDVPIPVGESERALDGVTTDLLLVAGYADMIFALIRWPQYARYMRIGSLG
jgi:hypothetical protein